MNIIFYLKDENCNLFNYVFACIGVRMKKTSEGLKSSNTEVQGENLKGIFKSLFKVGVMKRDLNKVEVTFMEYFVPHFSSFGF